jgi:hypothetical protein
LHGPGGRGPEKGLAIHGVEVLPDAESKDPGPNLDSLALDADIFVGMIEVAATDALSGVGLAVDEIHQPRGKLRAVGGAASQHIVFVLEPRPIEIVLPLSFGGISHRRVSTDERRIVHPGRFGDFRALSYGNGNSDGRLTSEDSNR